MRLMWMLGILIVVALSLAGEWLLATAALTVGILDHLYEWHFISVPAQGDLALRGESEKEEREQIAAEQRERSTALRAAREQAQREHEQAEKAYEEAQQRAHAAEGDEDDDSAPIEFFGGPMFEGRGLPTREDAMAKVMRRAKRQEEREKAAAAKQREAAKNDEVGEGSKTAGSHRAHTDQSDSEDGHYANYSTYRRKGPGVW